MPSPERRLVSLVTLVLGGLAVGLPWTAGGRSPTGQATLVLFLVLAAAAATFTRGLGAPIRPSPLVLAGIVLAGSSALSTIYPDRTVQTLLVLLAYLLAGTLASQAARHEPPAERLLLGAIAVSGLMTAAIGLYRLLEGSTEGLYARLLTGPFGYPNAMAGFLLVSGGAALALARGDRFSPLRIGSTAIGVLLLTGLFLTRSRGAFVAAAAGFVAWIVVERGRQSRWGALALLSGCAGLLAVLACILWLSGMLPLDFRRFAERADTSSLVWRWQILQWTWHMAKDHAWQGVGPGAFPVALTHYQRVPYVSGENPHNLYLEVAAEYGLPAAIFALAMFVGFLAKIWAASRRPTTKEPSRQRLAVLLATFVAFAVHSLVDLDWSFPAIAVSVAVMLGLASAHLGSRVAERSHTRSPWRGIFLLALSGAAVICASWYSAGNLVTWARASLAEGNVAEATRHLRWALRLNPLSYPAHHWMAWAHVFSRDPRGASELAARAARIAPLDPNAHFLAGEIAATSSRWDAAEESFRKAVEIAPAAQLRFHAALVEASVAAGKAPEARFRYEQAGALFTEERVLHSEARCLVPGDRYLLARMNRIVAPLYGETSHAPSGQRPLERATRLAQPDVRGICVAGGRPGQTSPEAAIVSLWSALSEGGWREAERFVTPRLRGSPPREEIWGKDSPIRRGRVAWIAALQGGETRTRLRFQLEIRGEPDRVVWRCAQAEARLMDGNWFVDRLPALDVSPCQP
jgi:O-antigen ligase